MGTKRLLHLGFALLLLSVLTAGLTWGLEGGEIPPAPKAAADSQAVDEARALTMDLARTALDVFLHLDRHLNTLGGDLGGWLYGLLFLIVFCETGLVVTPFLPGDSLLFAVGALATRPGSPINLPLVSVLLCVAAVLGDAVNYGAGSRVGLKVFTSETSRLLNKEHLMRAHRFYGRYGGKAIFLARFVPIIRTFAPFVAGIGQMSYSRFALYNVTGGIVWVNSFLLAGYFFADLPVVREQFHYIILAISMISIMPIGIEYLRARREARRRGPAASAAGENPATDSVRPGRSRS